MNDTFIQNAISFRGEEGKKWIERVPHIIRKYEQKWSIQVGDPFELSYNYVAPAVTSNDTRVVLKIGFPTDKEFKTEIEVLKIFNGAAITKLLKADVENAVLLLERLDPGKSVDTLENDKQETKIIASVMKKLWKPAPRDHTFPTVTDWFKGFARLREKFNKTSGPLPQKLFDNAEELFQHLLKTTTEEYLLHGDLHHGNVLSAQREPWLAIDPKGVVGDRVYETAALLHNPADLLKRENPKKILEKRINILSEELSFDRDRILKWGIAHTVLSAIWMVEDFGKDWEYAIEVAELLSTLQ